MKIPFITLLHQGQEEKNQSRRIESIDWIRGLAAFFVLFQHTMELYSPTFRMWTLEYINFGMVGVVAFFLVSGYVIAHTGRNKSALPFIFSRFFRIFPLYWTLLLAVLIRVLTLGKEVNLRDVFANVALLQDYLGATTYVGGSWTLALECIFYGLFIIWRRSRFCNLYKCIPLFCGLVSVGFILLDIVLLPRVPLGRPLLIFSAFLSMLICLSEEEKLTISTVKLSQYFIVLFGLIYFCFYTKSPVFNTKCLIFSWMAGYVLFFSLLKLSLNKFLNQILSFMGKISYSVYLCQGIVFLYIMDLYKDFFFFPFVTIGLVYFLAYCLYKIIEEPGIALGKRLYHSVSLRISVEIPSGSEKKKIQQGN